MTTAASISLVNMCLREIGKHGTVVRSPNEDLFSLGLSSIERLMLITTIERLSGRKLDMKKLGINARLPVSELLEALG